MFVLLTGVLCFVLVYLMPGCVVILAYALMGRRLWVVRPPFDKDEGSVSTQQVRQRYHTILSLIK